MYNNAPHVCEPYGDELLMREFSSPSERAVTDNWPVQPYAGNSQEVYENCPPSYSESPQGGEGGGETVVIELPLE